jgi:SAM-dependent methyltransferase
MLFCCHILQLLDLGCGYGGTAVHIAERLKCKAVGVNISPFQVTPRTAIVCMCRLLHGLKNYRTQQQQQQQQQQSPHASYQCQEAVGVVPLAENLHNNWLTSARGHTDEYCLLIYQQLIHAASNQLTSMPVHQLMHHS